MVVCGVVCGVVIWDQQCIENYGPEILLLELNNLKGQYYCSITNSMDKLLILRDIIHHNSMETFLNIVKFPNCSGITEGYEGCLKIIDNTAERIKLRIMKNQGFPG